MLAEEENDVSSCRKFFSLYNGMILKKSIPKAKGKRCMESMGWLITVGQDGEVSLLHPFSGLHIELPHPNDHLMVHPMTFFQKAVLSASPSCASDYVVMVIEGEISLLSFWRPGNLSWTRISNGIRQTAGDITYFNGHFYAVSYNGDVTLWDVCLEPKSRIVAQIPYVVEDRQGSLYILESLGSLFVVTRKGVQLWDIEDDSDNIPLSFAKPTIDGNPSYGTQSFRVFQVELATGTVTQTREIGDRAFFLGGNASLSVQASQFAGIKPNHIYFTDDYWESYLCYEEGGGLDMGVFSLADGKIQPHYMGVSLGCVCPPIWVTPTLY